MSPRQLSRSEFLGLSALLSGSALLRGTAQAAPAPPPKAAPGAALSREERMALRRSCRGALTPGSRLDLGTELVQLGEWVQRQGLARDAYGTSDFIQAFEKRVAGLLGHEDGCFMPTGTMGQLCVLRICADASGNRRVGLHPSSHHVLHEDDAHAVLHGLREVLLSPWERPLLAGDVREAKDALGTVSVELPVRWLGGQLQTWEQLEELKRTCKEKGVRLHMDGARLWECQPFYGKPYADICRGFDSVYVSFYKWVGALGGAMVVGTKELVRDARTWRHRHGGNVFQLLPYVASAAMRLDAALARVPADVKRAQAVADALAADTRLTVLPRPVQTPLFRVFLRGDPAALGRQRDRIAREDKVWVAGGFSPTRVPGVVETELQVGEAFGDLQPAQAARAFTRLLEANG